MRLIGTAGVVAFLVFAPWMIRDWLVFGSPLPGQAAANALSVTASDIFAWNDPPTVSRYLAVGSARLLEMRVEGFVHNVFNVLVLPGLPISIIGIVALPWQGRGAVLRPLVLFSALTFIVTTALFSRLHDVGDVPPRFRTHRRPDRPLRPARPRRRRSRGSGHGWAGRVRSHGWARSSGIFGSLLFSMTLLPTFASATQASASLYAELGRRMALAGEPLDAASRTGHRELPDLDGRGRHASRHWHCLTNAGGRP